ncbi:MAG: hypothetical protein IJB69_08425, partial [Clostridia bacterium]|nr:hypothetical protein [Clostridia bacterium]
ENDKKKRMGKCIFPPLIFSFSPDAFSIRQAAFTPPSPWCGGATPGSQYCNLLLHTGFCVLL